MKKVLIAILFILVLLGCLSIPTRYELKDGGTIVYKAVLWEHFDYHTLPDNKGKSLRGTLLKICGITVEDNTKKVKIKTEEDTTTTDKNTKKIDVNRYYQFKSESQEEGQYKYYEIELKKDGTAKTDYLRVLDTLPKEGIYVEDDKYIIVTLNTKNSECVEGNYEPKIADVCSETIIFIKDGDVLKTQRGAIYHFDIDNVNSSMEFKAVEKAMLQTSLKN